MLRPAEGASFASMPRFGPIQMLSVGFDGNRFKGEILPELDRLKAQDVIRVLDLLFVRKDPAGNVSTMKATDLDYEQAIGFGEYIGTLVGYAAGGVEGADRGAIAGAAELADGHLFDEDDAFQLTQALPNGMSAAIILLEHRWALPLLDAIEGAGGIELSNRWVNIEDLLAAGFNAAGAGDPEPLEP
jgi:uncharacterized membrane protein